MPDLLGFELTVGVKCLLEKGLTYQLKENSAPNRVYPSDLPKRIVRQSKLLSGEIELVYCFDTYQLGKES